jgi:hypothetical protein
VGPADLVVIELVAAAGGAGGRVAGRCPPGRAAGRWPPGRAAAGGLHQVELLACRRWAWPSCW